jgi:hypothetical protein
MLEARSRRANLASLAVLQAIFWAAQGSTGCMEESVPIGAMDAGAGGEGATDGTSGSGGTAGASGSFAKGGTSGKGGAAGRGGSSGAADPGGQGGSGLTGAGGSAGTSAGKAGGGGVSGTGGSAGGGAFGGTAGNAGESGGGAGGTSGTAGDAGSAGSAGSGLTGGDGGTAGGGGSGGSAGSAGGWNDPVDPWIIGAPNDIGCMSGAPCTARFQWRDSTIPWRGDYYLRDLSADGQWLTGFFDAGEVGLGGYKVTWDATELELLIHGDSILVNAASGDGQSVVGVTSTCQAGTCVSWAVSYTGQGPTRYFEGVPSNQFGIAVSSDASVMVACSQDYTESYVLRDGVATEIPGVGLEAISGNGLVFGGRRTTGGAVIVDGTTVIDVPAAGDWIPYIVRALNEDGSVAVGYAEDQSGLPLYPTQAFRWVRGGELTLLGVPPGMNNSYGDDCDASGDLVVGSAYRSDGTGYEPFLYRPSVGLRALRDDLLTHSVPLVPAELLMSDLRVSADGTRIAGGGGRHVNNIVWVADYLTGPALVPNQDP